MSILTIDIAFKCVPDTLELFIPCHQTPRKYLDTLINLADTCTVNRIEYLQVDAKLMTRTTYNPLQNLPTVNLTVSYGKAKHQQTYLIRRLNSIERRFKLFLTLQPISFAGKNALDTR